MGVNRIGTVHRSTVRRIALVGTTAVFGRSSTSGTSNINCLCDPETAKIVTTAANWLTSASSPDTHRHCRLGADVARRGLSGPVRGFLPANRWRGPHNVRGPRIRVSRDARRIFGLSDVAQSLPLIIPIPSVELAPSSRRRELAGTKGEKQRRLHRTDMAEPQHEPRGGPEIESMGPAASGRPNAQIAVFARRRGERVKATLCGRSRLGQTGGPKVRVLLKCLARSSTGPWPIPCLSG